LCICDTVVECRSRSRKFNYCAGWGCLNDVFNDFIYGVIINAEQEDIFKAKIVVITLMNTVVLAY
jgi:hypothetical protein